jgi:hypothetical protein
MMTPPLILARRTRRSRSTAPVPLLLLIFLMVLLVSILKHGAGDGSANTTDDAMVAQPVAAVSTRCAAGKSTHDAAVLFRNGLTSGGIDGAMRPFVMRLERIYVAPTRRAVSTIGLLRRIVLLLAVGRVLLALFIFLILGWRVLAPVRLLWRRAIVALVLRSRTSLISLLASMTAAVAFAGVLLVWLIVAAIVRLSCASGLTAVWWTLVSRVLTICLAFARVV